MKDKKIYRVRIKGTDQYFDGYTVHDLVTKTWNSIGPARSSITYFISGYHKDYNKNAMPELNERAELLKEKAIIEECILVVRDVHEYKYKDKSSDS